jgi:hypothetical protein
LHAGHGRWRGRFRAVSYPYTDAWGVVVVRVAEEVERQIAALTQFKEELDGLYERARKQPAPLEHEERLALVPRSVEHPPPLNMRVRNAPTELLKLSLGKLTTS